MAAAASPSTVQNVSVPLPSDVAAPQLALTLGAPDDASQEGTISEDVAVTPRRAEGLRPELPGYEILGELGRGGMGVVYRARQRKLNRIVALKMILAGSHAEDWELIRFRTEAEAIARLQHPNIVQVFEVGEWHATDKNSPLPYFSLEYCAGGSLQKKLKQSPLPPGQAAQLMETVARAMQVAHEHHIIHRDLKPANILLTAEGTPKITDFGLAKKLDQEAGQTHTGAVIGTPSYMAPEQAAGKVKEIGPTADIYALGATLYQCLTGQPPFKGPSSWATIIQVVRDEPIPPRRLQPRIPKDLETICLKCLHKEPERRYATALDLAEDLRRFQFGEPVQARRVGRAGRLWRWCRRNPGVAALSAVVLLLVMIGAGAAAYLISERDRSAADLAKARQVQTVWDELEKGTKLPPEQWTAAHAATVKARLQELSALDPTKGEAGAHQFYEDTVPALARQLLAESKLQPEHEKQVQLFIQLAAEQHLSLAKTLKQELEVRLSKFEDVFRLTPPFQKLPAVFHTIKNRIQVTDTYLASLVSATPAAIVLTDVPSQGSIGLKATFTMVGTVGTEFGLLLHATDAKKLTGYAFLLRAHPTKLAPGIEVDIPTSLADARAKGLPIYQQILLDGKLLRERELSANELPGDQPLVLSAKREGDRLSFQVNDHKPLEFFEIFPMPRQGVYGVVWPNGTRLQELHGQRRPLPAKPSPVEQGDAYFFLGHFDKAIQEYQRQTQAFQNAEVAQEAQVKEALAWVEKQQPKDAMPLLEKVASQPGPRWPYIAACQLWLLHIRQKDFPSARLVLNQLLVRKQVDRFDQLASLIPQQIRTEILQTYQPSLDFLAFSKADREEQIEKLKMLVDLEKTFDLPAIVRAWKYQDLVRSYRFNDQPQEAIDALKKWFAEETSDPFGFFREWVWLMIEQGTPQLAMPEVEKRLFVASIYNPNVMPSSLLVERARLLIALGRQKDAKADLIRIVRSQLALPTAAAGVIGLAGYSPGGGPLVALVSVLPQGPVRWGGMDYRAYSDACLLLGFLCADRGDKVGAKEFWTLAVYSDDLPNTLPGLNVLNIVFTHLLSDQLPDAKLDKYLDWGLHKVKMPAFVIPLLKKSMPFSKAFRAACARPEGYDFIRKYAYRQLPFRDVFLVPPELGGTELICLQAFGGKFASAQEHKLTRDFVRDSISLFLEKKLTTTTALNVGLLWQNPRDAKAPVILSSLRNSLPPPLFGPAAYLFGRRYQQLGRKDLSHAFFEEALQAAPPGSDLAQLAQAAWK